MPKGRPQAQAFYPDGTAIPEAKLADALKAGTLGYMPGDTVTMVGPDGSRIEGPAEKVPEAVRQGWRPESPTEKKAADFREISEEFPVLSRVAVFAGRASSAASLGQSDFVNRLLLPEQADFAAGLTSALPGTELAGEIAGIAATLPAGGAVGAGFKGLAGLTRASRVAAALGETGALGRFAVRTGGAALRGAAEVGTFEAGQELARASMADDDVTAERLLSAFGKGAGIGAVGAAGFELAAPFAGRIGRALGRLAEPESAAVRAIGGRGTELQKLGAEGRQKVGRALLDEVTLPAVGSIPEEKVASVLSGSLGAKAKKIDAVRRGYGERIGELVRGVDAAGAKPDLPAFRKAVGDWLGELRGPLLTGDKKKVLDRIEKNWLRPLSEAQTFSEIQAVRRDIAKGIYSGLGKNTRKELERGFERRVEEAFEAELSRAATPESLALYQELKRGYSTFKGATDISAKALERTEGVKALGAFDFLSAGTGVVTGLAHGGPAGLATTLGMEAVGRAVKSDRAEALLARALDAIRGGTDTSALKVEGAVRDALLKGARPVREELPAFAGKVLSLFAERSEAPRQAQASPEASAAAVADATKGVMEADADLGRKTQALLAGDVAWLQQRLPPAPPPSSAPRGDEVPRVPVSAASSYVRAERALSNPVAELERLREKRLTPELVAVLRERRPKFQEQVRATVQGAVASLAAEGRRPDYVSRVQLSLVSGTAVDPTMRPEAVAAYQAVWRAKREGKPAPGPAPGRPTPESLRRRARTRRTGAEMIEEGPAD